MKIIGYDPYVSADNFSDDKITVVDFDTLVKESDYITLHLPINESTRNLFTTKQFKMMNNMMKKMSKGDPKDGIPPEIFNQLK